MANQKSIAVLSPYLPAADTSGGARVIFDSLRSLQAAGYAVHLLSFCSAIDAARAPETGKYCYSISLERLKDYSAYPQAAGIFRPRLDFLLKSCKKLVVQCEYGFMAHYFRSRPGISAVLREHDILSRSFFERARCQSNSFGTLAFLARALRKKQQERSWYKKFEKIVVFSKEDKEYLARGQARAQRLSIIPLGVDLSDRHPLIPAPRGHQMLFVGNFSHGPNVDAALYFCNDIFPLIRKVLPQVRVTLAGALPPACVTALGKREGVTVTGYFSQAESHYAASNLVIAPLRYGSGMRVKILEAMSLARPVVSTSLGCRGIDPCGILQVADSANDFSASCIRLLRDDLQAQALAQSGRQAVEERYAQPKVFEQYKALYDSFF